MSPEAAGETLDPHTGFLVRESQCTGCRMCVLACSAIKEDRFSFSNGHSFVEIDEATEAAAFTVRFTEACDGCTYCLQFCGYDAIAKPEGWTLAPHLQEIRGAQQVRRRAAAQARRDG